jgi:hypothetical protein
LSYSWGHRKALEAQRRERQNTRQHLIECLDLSLNISSLSFRCPLLGFEMLLLTELLTFLR